MKKKTLIFTFIVIAFAFYANAKSIYPIKINTGNAVITNIADLSNCFDNNNQPVFDELYIYGRIWQERQDTNFYKLPNITLQQLKQKNNLQDIDVANILPDTANRQILWYVEPQIRCTLAVEKHYNEVHYIASKDKFGVTTCQPTYTSTILPDSTKYIYTDYSDTLPDSAISIIAQANDCSCRWTTSQDFTIREYFDYDYILTTYRWVGTPDTLTDTVGCIVMRINQELFNTHLEGTNRTPMGELHYIDGATEWISPTDTAFIPEAPGGGTHVSRMIWAKDTIQDTYYWNKNYPFDTIYTVFRFNPRGTTYYYNGTTESNSLTYSYYNEYQSNDKSTNILSVTAALYERNSKEKTQNTITHADVVKYVRDGDAYKYSTRWDGKEQGVPEIKSQGKKIYFTGKLVPASIYGINSNGDIIRSSFSGAMSGQGDGPAAIYIHNRGRNDIYLENFQIGTRSLTVEGDEPTSMFDKVPRKYINAAITLEGNGQDTYIHFQGKNYLCGNNGKSTISTLYGAAVYMNVNATDYLSLTFDDTWVDGSHTDGLLKMEGSTDEQIGNTHSTYHCTASPIYSGNNRTAVTFNGGKYHLSPADNSTSTINFMIVSRRLYRTPLVEYVIPDVGSDVGDGLVYIKAGTFRMTTPLLSNPHNNITILPNGEQYNREYYVMYFPLRTYITGGSFENCLVKTTDGDASAPDCTGITTCPTNGKDTVFAYYIPYSIESKKALFDYDNDAIADDYESEHLIPTYDEKTNEYYIIPYLPSKGEMKCENYGEGNMQNWDFMFPSGVNADISNQNRPLIVTQKQNNGEELIGTNYFAMCEINPYYPNKRQTTPSHLTEEGDFTIDKRIYLITWTMADNWIVKTMPFDVSNVTLIHTWATDSLGNTPDPDLEWDYYQKTMQTIILRGRLSELEKERGLNMPFWSFYQRAVTSHEPDSVQRDNSGTKYLPQVARTALPIYYKGQSDTLAPSYHLFEAINTPLPDGSYCYAWKIPQPDSDGIIMHKGHTYAFKFPNTTIPGGNGYNFWDGKYIVLEGPGQTISNSKTIDNISDENNIKITGNNTFNIMRNAPDLRYDWNYPAQRFERYTYTSVEWSGAYIYAGTQAWENNQRFDLECLLNPTAATITNAESALTVTQNNNIVNITSGINQNIYIYSATGQLYLAKTLSNNDPVSVILPQGIYLIISPQTNETIKIICQ